MNLPIGGKRRNDLAFALVLTVLFLVLAWDLQNTIPRSRLFPIALLVVAIPLTLIIIWRLMWSNAPLYVESQEAIYESEPNLLINRQVAWVFGFFIVSWLIGLEIVAPAGALIYLRIEARVSWLWSIIATAALYVFVFIVLRDAVAMSFPQGELFN